MNEKLISVCIPTWNMADRLEATLNSIVPQALEFKNEVELCISNNGSTDNTRGVVIKFKEKYPDLTIRYNENEKNLGFDRNLIKVVNLAEGKFVWTFGDDKIAENGLMDVLKFIKKCDDKKIGLIVVGTVGYCRLNGERAIYRNTVDKDKPNIFKLDGEDIINRRFDYAFISAVLYNNKILKNIFSDETTIINQSFDIGYIHRVFYCLMFMKYPYLKGYVINKPIVLAELYLKPTLETVIVLGAKAIKTENLILSIPYSKYDATLFHPILTIESVAINMVAMKAFGCFNYDSFTSVIKLCFYRFRFIYAIVISLLFVALSIIPSTILKSILRLLFKIKYGISSDERFFLFSRRYILSSKFSEKKDITYYDSPE